MSDGKLKFNPPPGWPMPPRGWVPPKGWSPDPNWPDPPEGWQLWVPAEMSEGTVPEVNLEMATAEPSSNTNNSLQDGSDVQDVERQLSILTAENAALKVQLEHKGPGDELVILDDEIVLQEIGIYRYHHPLESADAYKDRLAELCSKIAETVKAKEAILMSNTFTFDNSLAKGRRMSNDLAKLMLRAYNAEVDNSLRSLRAGNVQTARKRIDSSRNAIKKLGKIMEMEISDLFHNLRIDEIELTADYLMKKQEEKEAAREERARLREEKKVEAELTAQREKLDKERKHIVNTIAALKASGETDLGLEKKLAELDEAIVQNDFRAANIRAGYVYMISNRGAFGKGVIKIGLTRRLEPIDRVNELSGASVPFRFDVHCLFFSEDAVTLEADLHNHFSDRRVNQANLRKEFFFATPGEVRSVLASKVGSLLEFNEEAESTEFHQSINSWPREVAGKY